MNSDLELPLIKDNQYKTQYEPSNVSFHQKSENIIGAKHDKIHFRANVVQYLILLMVGISYLIYGVIKYLDSNNHPLTKTYQDNISSYPLPTTLACVDYNFSDIYQVQQYFGLTSISYLDVNADFNDMTCDYIYNASEIETLTDLNKCLILHQVTDWEGPLGTANCFVIFPPSNIKNSTAYTIQYQYWREGFIEPDPFIGTHLNYSSPSFLNDQWRYNMYHSVFHLDDLLSQNQEAFSVSNDYSNMLIIALHWAEEYYAFPFSYNKVLLSFQQYSKLNGDVMDSFDITEGTKVTSIDEFAELNCDNGLNSTYDICARITMLYLPKRKGKTYLVTYTNEYSDYQLPDLFSGIGGILSTAQGIVGTIFSFLLLGFGFLCINWSGLAPYPTFDDNFRERIQRLLD